MVDETSKVDEDVAIAFLNDLRCGDCQQPLIVVDRRNGHIMCNNGNCPQHSILYYWPNVVLEKVEVEVKA